MDKVKKPYGYSWFPYELASAPKSWAEATGKVSFFKSHDKVTLLKRPLYPEK
jgi:microsomal epoxide hydrolase